MQLSKWFTISKVFIYLMVSQERNNTIESLIEVNYKALEYCTE